MTTKQLEKLVGSLMATAMKEAYDMGYRDGRDAEVQSERMRLPKNHQKKSRKAALADILARAGLRV